MNPDTSTTASGLERQPSHGYASSESESKRPGGSSGKKRASRAGTRSVTTLSAAQLERKRANDREAQRGIRQRTKDHIDSLEKTVSELRGSQESNEKIVAVTRQRNLELEGEIAYLRSKLSDGGYVSEAPPVDSHRPSDSGMLSTHSTSPAAHSVSGSSIQRPSSTSRSLSATTASTNSRHGSFQQQSSFLPTPGSAATISDQSSMSGHLPLTAWRSHDGSSSVHPVQAPQPQAPDPLQPQQSHPYQAMHHQDRSEWVAAPQQYQYTVNSEPQRPHHYEAQQGAPPPLSAVQHHYPQPLVQPYTPAPAPSPVPQQQSHQPPQMPPQAEFQNMAVSSPAYHVQQQQTYQQPMQQQAYPPPQQPQSYQQPTHMQVGPMQGGLPSVAEYTASHGNMQPPPVPTSQYQPPPTEQQHYVSQTMHPPLQYRNEATGQSFTLGHYPSG